MNYRDDEKRLLIWRISDEKIADGLKSYGPRGEVRSLVPLMWKNHKFADGLQDILTETGSSSGIVLGDELPNFGDVLHCSRVKLKSLVIRHFRASFRVVISVVRA